MRTNLKETERIKEYMLIEEATAGRLNMTINEYLNKGYKLYGNTIFNQNDNVYAQALIKV